MTSTAALVGVQWRLQLWRLGWSPPGWWEWLLWESSLISYQEPLFEQNPPVQTCHSQQAPSLSDSPTFQPDWRLSVSVSVTAQLVSLLQVSPGSPISLVMTQPASTVSADEHCPCAPATSFIPPSSDKHPGPSWRHSILPVWQGREPLTRVSSKTPAAGPARARPRVVAALVPTLVLGNL